MSDIYFFKGNQNVLDRFETNEEKLIHIKEELAKVFDTKSLSLLLGSGCSSYIMDNEEVGIPTMQPLAKEFYNYKRGDFSLTKDEKIFIVKYLHINLSEPPFCNNLEKFLEVLISFNFYLKNMDVPDATQINKGTFEDFLDEAREHIPPILKKTKEFILKKCLNEENPDAENPLLRLYETFYRKLLYRNPNLPKPNIFTTNYDLYSEKALDNIGVLYANGFSGGINKYFNPTIFNYAYAERLDISQSRWNIIDNFIYLYKIHGSINWVEDTEVENKIFSIKEIQNPSFGLLKEHETIMIYPTPTKQNSSLGSPYSDLFREFQKKLMQINNSLMTIGYSFSDEHINNLIFQAFTIPTFRLIIFIDKNTPMAEKLLSLNDPRIWVIGGILERDDEYLPLHFFNQIVNCLLPDMTNEEIDKQIQTALKKLINE